MGVIPAEKARKRFVERKPNRARSPRALLAQNRDIVEKSGMQVFHAHMGDAGVSNAYEFES